ncbi:hypothetical protein BV25DRAFT_1926578 [Artomyces pyxidatus]|uniref:Uncharacterized protein n=1 Tax=Artomyces pyxidatus TaxID=48021 RepID=A0ACB8TLA6_9AGAM|nr:hypothetical protein BV25DRAFT_1926578 [Artomyces pyxidatus]
MIFVARIEILKPYDNASVALLEQVLAQRVKPVFQTNPHPLLNSNTGRKMPRAAGGLMATQDAYEGQAWKEHPGIANVLLWCLQRIDTDAYERLWYLVVPPTMTLLDDFEVRYKLEGIQVVAAMLERAPPDLLRRTGVADLVFASLQRSLTFLHSPSTPDVIRASVPTAVSLVLRTTQPGSETRFNQLCALLGDGIIGSVWMYAYQDPDAIEASVDVLPTLLEAMDIGAVRYLKAIIPQLTHPLIPNSYGTQVPGLQMASLKALLSVIRHCAPRMFKWKGTLLEAVGKCWVTLLDSGKTDKVSLDQRQALREVCVELLKAAPSAREDFDKLLSLDKLTFESLVGDKIALI